MMDIPQEFLPKPQTDYMTYPKLQNILKIESDEGTVGKCTKLHTAYMRFIKLYIIHKI